MECPETTVTWDEQYGEPWHATFGYSSDADAQVKFALNKVANLQVAQDGPGPPRPAEVVVLRSALQVG